MPEVSPNLLVELRRVAGEYHWILIFITCSPPDEDSGPLRRQMSTIRASAGVPS